MIKHYNITIEGRVQGVGFRFYARNQARLFGIKGYVMNECDGSVYIEAEGKPQNLQQYINWCHQGPPAADITNVDVEEGDVQNYSVFDVRH